MKTRWATMDNGVWDGRGGISILVLYGMDQLNDGCSRKVKGEGEGLFMWGMAEMENRRDEKESLWVIGVCVCVCLPWVDAPLSRFFHFLSLTLSLPLYPLPVHSTRFKSLQPFRYPWHSMQVELVSSGYSCNTLFLSQNVRNQKEACHCWRWCLWQNLSVDRLLQGYFP